MEKNIHRETIFHSPLALSMNLVVCYWQNYTLDQLNVGSTKSFFTLKHFLYLWNVYLSNEFFACCVNTCSIESWCQVLIQETMAATLRKNVKNHEHKNFRNSILIFSLFIYYSFQTFLNKFGKPLSQKPRFLLKNLMSLGVLDFKISIRIFQVIFALVWDQWEVWYPTKVLTSENTLNGLRIFIVCITG